MKLINDTLKNANGKYSRKSVTSFTLLVMAILVGSHIVLSDFYLPVGKEINSNVVNVFLTFLSGGTGTLILTVWDKKRGLNE